MTELATQELARARAARIRAGIANYLHTLADISSAYAQRDWVALGYPDWQAYVDGEYGAERLRLTPEHRQKAVAELRLAGMSQRAIGTALGVDQKTVSNDLRTEENSSVQPERILSLDGRERPATRPTEDHPSATGEADAPLDAAACDDPAAVEAPAGGATPAGAGDDSPTGPVSAPSAGHPQAPDRSGPDFADAMAEAIEQARERAAQQKADRDALCAPREVVDAVNAATHFVPAMVAIQTGCEGLLSAVKDVDPEKAVTDLPIHLLDRLSVARDAYAYLTRVVDALDQIGVPA